MLTSKQWIDVFVAIKSAKKLRYIQPKLFDKFQVVKSQIIYMFKPIHSLDKLKAVWSVKKYCKGL